jgi:hypothetical protein
LIGQTAAELNTDGTINTSYGTNGVSGVFKSSFGAAAVADDGSVIMPLDAVDEKNVVSEFSLRRVRPDGKLDRTFGNNGKVLLSTSSQATALAEATQIAPDGTIVAASQAGQLSPSGKVDTRSFAVARLYSGEGPSLQLVPKTLKSASRYLSMTVLIRDNDGVDVTTLDNNDLRLFDDAGDTRRIRFLSSEDVNGDGKYIRATYRIIAPDGLAWTSAHNGRYEVRLQRKQVFDKDGNGATAQVLGTLRVKIS